MMKMMIMIMIILLRKHNHDICIFLIFYFLRRVGKIVFNRFEKKFFTQKSTLMYISIVLMLN